MLFTILAKRKLSTISLVSPLASKSYGIVGKYLKYFISYYSSGFGSYAVYEWSAAGVVAGLPSGCSISPRLRTFVS